MSSQSPSSQQLERILEPEFMDSWEEAEEYDNMDHTEVNRRFAEDLVKKDSIGNDFLDLGTGTALIPIELCKLLPKTARIMASDASQPMLELARYRIEVAGLNDRIQLHYGDCKQMPFAETFFDTVFSNTLIHHVPDPSEVLKEAWRVLRPGGLLFIRDLARPANAEIVEQLVLKHASGHSPRGQQLLRQSLHAALRPDELQQILVGLGIPSESIEMTSDRHWTLSARKPAELSIPMEPRSV